MQSKQRFGELHNVCFIEENYPYDIFKFLEMFRSPQFREGVIYDFPLAAKPDNFLEYQNISDEVKQRFEMNISLIQSINYNGTAISFFTNPYIGDWYLKEINDSSIVGYYNAIPRSGAFMWRESIYNLKYQESEIVYCIMKKLSRYYEQNNKFEVEFNKYKAFFDGTVEEFLECLINEYEDFKFHYSGWYYMNKIEGYDGLRRKLIEMVNNLSTPAHKEIEQGKDKKVKIKTPTFVVMLEVAETINKEEKFLPKDWINRTDKLSKYKKAIFDRFGYVYSESTIKNNFDKNLTDRHRLKVIKMLNDEYGRRDLAEQYRIHYKSNK